MAAKRNRKLRRTVVFLLFPALILLALLGWCMYWSGDAEQRKHETRKASKKDTVTVLPMPLEETFEAPNE